ncbi:MAG: YaiI/YqxD family protein [Gammaproteobacteria bacterium]|nr:YaiI/YqxD family protein [Gammaproteobacteria bacterium]
MKIWVDGDSCPVVIRDILCKAAERVSITTTFIANQPLPLPASKWVKFIQVRAGFDVADNEIIKRLTADDLVVTGDIPLAAQAIEKGGLVLSPRGEVFTADNISARLTMRDFMESLRASGVESGGPAPLSQRDRKTFADCLDKVIRKSGY